MTNKPHKSEANDGGPAFPRTTKREVNGGMALEYTFSPGLSKREYFAGLAMQGLIAMESKDKAATFGPEKITTENIARLSVNIADALLVKLNKTNT